MGPSPASTLQLRLSSVSELLEAGADGVFGGPGASIGPGASVERGAMGATIAPNWRRPFLRSRGVGRRQCCRWRRSRFLAPCRVRRRRVAPIARNIDRTWVRAIAPVRIHCRVVARNAWRHSEQPLRHALWRGRLRTKVRTRVDIGLRGRSLYPSVARLVRNYRRQTLHLQLRRRCARAHRDEHIARAHVSGRGNDGSEAILSPSRPAPATIRGERAFRSPRPVPAWSQR